MKKTNEELTQINREIEAVIMKHFDLKKRPGFVMTLTLPPYREAYYFMNVRESDAVMLISDVSDKLKAKQN